MGIGSIVGGLAAITSGNGTASRPGDPVLRVVGSGDGQSTDIDLFTTTLPKTDSLSLLPVAPGESANSSALAASVSPILPEAQARPVRRR